MPISSRPFSPRPGGSRPGGGFKSRPGGGSFRPGSRPPRRDGEEGRGGRFNRKKINRFYSVFSERTDFVDFKDTERLTRFLTERGKIMPRRITGLTAKQQRLIAGAIKRARHAGFLPFESE